jgi:acetyltransferase-like isoleucine patch superfamily enzyme
MVETELRRPILLRRIGRGLTQLASRTNMVDISIFSRDELDALLGEVGDNVSIHRSVVVFNGKQIRLASNVRIDCFSLLSAGDEGIEIGHHVHVAAGVHIFGGGGRVLIQPFCGLSGRVSLYTATEDYSEGYMSNPLVPEDLKKLKRGGITLGRHTLVGASSVIMPGVKTGIGAAIGALSFVNKSIPEFTIVSDNPLRKVGTRGKLLLELEKKIRDAD